MTAVEWFVNEIKIARKLCDDQSMEMDIWHTLDILIAKGEKAKEIEKQQIIDAYNVGYIYPIKFDFKNLKSQDSEQYYNETFKQL